MLDSRNNADALVSVDRRSGRGAGEERVGAEAFPVAPRSGLTSYEGTVSEV